jgi:phosphatidylglycerophosphatase A
LLAYLPAAAAAATLGSMESTPRPEAESRPAKRWALTVVASCFGLGYSPIMPGTCGALVGVAIYIPLALIVPGEPWQSLLIALNLLVWCVLTVALGKWAEEYYLTKDSSIFVTDEVAGFLLTVLLWHIPDQPVLTTLWAFPVTRAIDILKVPPAKQLEELPAGWGVLLDDLLGSVYAAALLWAISLAVPAWFGGSVSAG